MICLHPDCPLKTEGSDARRFAMLVLTSNQVKHLAVNAPASGPIRTSQSCIFCASRVLDGGNAYLTEAEWEHLDYLGHWHHRRFRR